MRSGSTNVDSSTASTASTQQTASLDLNQIVAEHADAVYRLANSVVRDASLADDVTQETFIKVWKHAEDFRGEGSFRGWILRIAHREAISALRRRRDVSIDPTDPAGAIMAGTSSDVPLSRVVEGHLAYDDFRAALNSLDDLSRAVLVLRELEGLSYDEVAEVLNVPIPTVKTRLLRARRSLSTTLEGWRP